MKRFANQRTQAERGAAFFARMNEYPAFVRAMAAYDAVTVKQPLSVLRDAIGAVDAVVEAYDSEGTLAQGGFNCMEDAA